MTSVCTNHILFCFQRDLDRDSQLKLSLRSTMAKKEVAENELKSCQSELATIKTRYEQKMSELRKEKLRAESEFAEVTTSSYIYVSFNCEISV